MDETDSVFAGTTYELGYDAADADRRSLGVAL
jgi:hypothetical protein